MITNADKRKRTMKVIHGSMMKIVVKNQVLLGVVLQNVKKQKEKKRVKGKMKTL
jgi:hypothetical protein